MGGRGASGRWSRCLKCIGLSKWWVVEGAASSELSGRVDQRCGVVS